jgi:hypothetical protein
MMARSLPFRFSVASTTTIDWLRRARLRGTAADGESSQDGLKLREPLSEGYGQAGPRRPGENTHSAAGMLDELRHRDPVRRLGALHEVAMAGLLVCGKGRFVYGRLLQIDGGVVT